MSKDKLTKRQESFLGNLLLTGNVSEASRLSNITRATGYNYLKDATFTRIYRQRRAEQLKETTTLLKNASVKAVKVLTDIMEDETVSPYARQQSAQTILSMAYKATETTEIVEQLEILEGKLLDDES